MDRVRVVEPRAGVDFDTSLDSSSSQLHADYTKVREEGIPTEVTSPRCSTHGGEEEW